MSDNHLHLVWATVIVLVVGFVSVTILRSNLEDSKKISEMVKDGKDPIVAACAVKSAHVICLAAASRE